ncbi:MAG TPA: alpha/beta hydrolase [Saprospiraceae bacterium]
MSIHRKRKIKRWSVRILILVILLPFVTLAIVRYAGWFRMRKTDREIKAYLGPHVVTAAMDTLSLRGRDIVYLQTAKGEQKKGALVFVHGSPGSIDAFLDYMVDTSLLARVDLVCYDRPGFGNSTFGYSVPSLSGQAVILNSLMDSLGYEHYWLAGHSYGAPILVQSAMRRPSKVEGLCLIAGSVSPELEPTNIAWRKWLDLPLLRDLLPVSMKVSNEELMPLRQDLTMIDDDWDRLKMSVSIIHGTQDALVPFGNLEYAKSKLIAADTVTTLIFNGESHFILWTHKQQIVG